MQAVKVFNNNAVSVVMPDGREAILVGNGLGFGRRPGDVIDKSRVSKVYYVQNELQTKFLKMLDNVTPQVMQPNKFQRPLPHCVLLRVQHPGLREHEVGQKGALFHTLQRKADVVHQRDGAWRPARWPTIP